MNTSEQNNCSKSYPLFVGYLPQEFEEKLENEVQEKTETRKEKIEQVRELLKNESNIRQEWFSDQTIVMYLRGCKYRIPETVAAIKKMVNFVRKNKSFFQPLDTTTLEHCVEIGYPKISPIRNADGCTILLFRISDLDPSLVSFESCMAYFLLMFLKVMSDPMTQVNGFIFLHDFVDSLQLRYANLMTPTKFKMYHHLLMECLPSRKKAFHMLNPNLGTRIALKILMPLNSKKINQRIHVHERVEDILDHLPADVIPIEYGGKLLPHEMKSDWVKTTSMPDYILSILKSKD